VEQGLDQSYLAPGGLHQISFHGIKRCILLLASAPKVVLRYTSGSERS